MLNNTIPESVSRALGSLMTRKVGCGAAVALAVGLGLGAWLEPPKPQVGSQQMINPPQEQPNLWGQDVSSTSALPYNQPETTPDTSQSASVSPPAETANVQIARANAAEVAAAGDTSTAQPAEPQPTQVTYTRPQPLAAPPAASQPQIPPGPPRAQGRDWAAYDVRDRGARYGGEARDDPDDLPPPQRWQAPPERRWSQAPERRWDFRPDGTAVPLGDEGDGG